MWFFCVDCQAGCQEDTLGGFWVLQRVHSGIGYLTDGALSDWQMSDERLLLSALYVTLLFLSLIIVILVILPPHPPPPTRYPSVQ